MNTFDERILTDPTIFEQNRMPAHSDHAFYSSVENMEEGSSTYRLSLNGIWKFHYSRNPALAPAGFEKNDCDVSSWDTIRVPSDIQMEGYDVPAYVNTQYPWDGIEELKPGEVPSRFNPTASYVKMFTLPETWENQKVCISFGGAESAIAVWMNGEYVGYAEDSFTPSDFDLTPYIKNGENRLACRVYKWAAGSWCEDQDFFRFSGIFRDVTLYTQPSIHIRDLKITTPVADDFKSAKVVIRALTETAGGRVPEKGTLSLRLSYKGSPIAESIGPVSEECSFELPVKEPRLWSAEKPQLYDLLITVSDSGETTEVIPAKVGIRRFEMKDSLMLINGKRIVFKGVDRHDFSSVHARHVSFEETLTDILTMKRNNINAIRTSHYPNQSILYALCDEYGIYVMDEANVETHGTWQAHLAGKPLSYVLPGDHKEWQELIIDRGRSMYERDKNHACIVIWSCGNESYGGSDLYEMSQSFRKWDPTRLVHYEGITWDRRYNDTSDMESRMYTPAAEVAQYLKEHRDKPLIMCEYAHSMGNSLGALNKYTELADREMLYQGGFIWDYIDQSITKKNRFGEEFQAYGGDFGERPTDYNFSGNGIVYGGDRKPSPKMQAVKYCYQDFEIQVKKEKFIIINKALFTDASEYDCLVTVKRDGTEIRRANVKAAVSPLSMETFELPFAPENEAGEYAVVVRLQLKEDASFAKKGYEIAFGQFVYETEKEFAESCRPLEVIHGDFNLGVRGENFECLFSYLSSGLVSYKFGGREMVQAIPRPNFWRAPTDNDEGCMNAQRAAQWKIASLYAKVPKDDGTGKMLPVVDEEKGSVSVSYTYKLPTKPAAVCTLSYLVHGNGKIHVNLSMNPVKDLDDLPEFGVLMELNADYDELTWYGNGPEETYWDRSEGAKLGIYHNKVEDNLSKYLVPQECGNHTGVRWAEVTDRFGHGFRFEGPGMNFSALPYTPHELENAKHAFELPRYYHTVVKLSKVQMGVGGDDSWGARVHKEYRIRDDKRLSFTFSFRGIE